MKKVLTLAFLPLTLLIAFGLTGCGGDDDDAPDSGDGVETTTSASDDSDDGDSTTDRSDLEEYYAAMEEILISTDQETDAVSEPIEQDFADDQEYITALQEAFQGTGEILETTLLELSELDPPSELVEAHQNLLDGVREVLLTSADFLTDAADVTTGEEMAALFAEYDPTFTETDDDLEDSCLDLQLIADANQVGVDLQCLS